MNLFKHLTATGKMVTLLGTGIIVLLIGLAAFLVLHNSQGKTPAQAGRTSDKTPTATSENDTSNQSVSLIGGGITFKIPTEYKVTSVINSGIDGISIEGA